MKIDGRTELIFSQAVALSQSGRMRSVICVKEKSIFILNMDNTILLKFSSPQHFEKSFSFYADDYEGSAVEVGEGKVAFVQRQGEFRRKKVCAQAKRTFEEILKIWNGYQPEEGRVIVFSSSMVSLLEDYLSHIEISKKEKLKLVQRDIYSGNSIEITKHDGGIYGRNFQFSPFGIRTVDFKALFSFCDDLFIYLQENKNWVFLRSNRFEGVLSTCLYDELGYMTEEEDI